MPIIRAIIPDINTNAKGPAPDRNTRKTINNQYRVKRYTGNTKMVIGQQIHPEQIYSKIQQQVRIMPGQLMSRPTIRPE